MITCLGVVAGSVTESLRGDFGEMGKDGGGCISLGFCGGLVGEGWIWVNGDMRVLPLWGSLEVEPLRQRCSFNMELLVLNPTDVYISPDAPGASIVLLQDALRRLSDDTLPHIDLPGDTDPMRRQRTVGRAVQSSALGVVAVQGHFKRGFQLRKLVHAVEASFAAAGGAGFEHGGPGFGGGFPDSGDAHEDGHHAWDAGADDGEAAFDAGPDCEVDGEA